VTETPHGPGWWLASDGKWYPPEFHHQYRQYSGPYPFPPPRPARTNGLAIASLVLSLTAFFIGPVLAIIFGVKARRQIRESAGRESGDGLALAGLVIGIVELALSLVLVSIFGVLISTGFFSRIEEQRLAIAGAPGYWTATGPVGLAFEEGRPWGEPCQPIVFDLDDTIPGPQVILIEQAIQNARALGLDVTYAYPDNLWYPSTLYPAGQSDTSVQIVNITPSEQWPSPVDDDGLHEHIEFGWDARVSSNGRNEVLTDVSATLFIHAVVGHPQSTKRAVRELVAFSLGVAGSSAPGSTISSGNTETGFSRGDINAMQRMSGCTFRPTATSHPDL
jgi:Domain of unknown function (DUF4190)